MATIVVGAVGTWGDVLPLAALAMKLKSRGHRIRFVANPAHRRLLQPLGLEIRTCGRPYGPAQAQRPLVLRKGWSPVVSEVKKAESCLLDTPAQFRDLKAGCRGADLLIGHSFQYAAMLVHDQLAIPWVSISLTPGQFLHPDTPACTQPAPRATLNLLASSPKFSSPSLDLHEYVRMTGFLFFDGELLPNWRPDAKLRSFVEEQGNVLLLSLGCLPGPKAQELAAKCVRAARRLERPLVIQTGWAAIDSRTWPASRVLVSGPVSHDWLLARTEAVIHHGSVGLCARALRHGVPMLLLPQRKDQFFNAHAVVSLGAGVAVLPGRVTGEGVSRVLSERVLVPGCRRAAARVASKLRRENGLLNACREVERLLK